ncbi:SAM-dependent methyltransferase [Prauserella sp. PE36]|uniref:SAM-dependent methyltransferase n=1 Tax=Prauserella endophytica TaxID=1592324 RepID=A0ABY2S3J2_9PSEU|nr:MULTISPECIES: class I SAM-dependent methyltransferase [Prauserella]PXY25082.1 SAM-dependent methyltransferase [Prauserella coralliicola]RBM23504.1 SAM-dependent methyltransferase [Prauserella sp. PE36]TKG69163.1 SAM-dependent methyltransferase [Prauserella endophytica]
MTTTRAEALHLTGERTVPGVPEENYWYARHEAAYLALLPYCTDATVLEAGCGEGYGAALIARHARRVLALDYDEQAIAHVGRRYPGVGPVRGNLAFLPVGTAAVDVVANFQVIEHLWDQDGFLAECHRVLRPGGRLLVTTPNRLTFTPDSDTPLNPYHTRELAPSELDELLRANGFEVELLHGLHHGEAVRALDERYGGSIIDAQLDVVMGNLPGQATWPEALLADVAAIRATDFAIHGEGLDASLDLVAVAVRP